MAKQRLHMDQGQEGKGDNARGKAAREPMRHALQHTGRDIVCTGRHRNDQQGDAGDHGWGEGRTLHQIANR